MREKKGKIAFFFLWCQQSSSMNCWPWCENILNEWNFVENEDGRTASKWWTFTFSVIYIFWTKYEWKVNLAYKCLFRLKPPCSRLIQSTDFIFFLHSDFFPIIQNERKKTNKNLHPDVLFIVSFYFYLVFVLFFVNFVFSLKSASNAVRMFWI